MKKPIILATAALMLCGCNNNDNMLSVENINGSEETAIEKTADSDVKENESFEEALEIAPDGSMRRASSVAYTNIKSMGYNYEVPDEIHNIAHIEMVDDNILNKSVYKFKIHADRDNDPSTGKTDRQRCEVKTDGHSPAQYVGQEGETMTFTWKFRLLSTMLTTTKFCHVHQLKGLDNSSGTADVSMPLITFTAVTVSGNQKFQVRYHNRNDNTTTKWATVDLANFKGKWVTVTETCKFGSNGTYNLTIKDYKTGNTIVSISKSGVDMWRTGTAGMRPKWGIYRYIGENGSLRSSLNDEYPRFADFTISKD